MIDRSRAPAYRGSATGCTKGDPLMATWMVEVQLTKTSGLPPESKIKRLEQLAAVAAYRKLVKALDESYPDLHP